MNFKLKLPFVDFLKPLQHWIKVRQDKFWQLVSPMQDWRNGSWVLNDRLLGGLLVVMIGTLPFLENAQTGVIGVAAAIALVMLWLTDRRALEPQATETSVFTPLLTYWGISVLAAAFSPVKIAAIDGLIKLTIYMLAFVSMHRLMGIGWRSLLVGAYLTSCLVSSAYGVQQWYLGAPELATWTDPTSDSAGITRVYSFLGNPNLFAGYLMPALPLGLVGAIRWQSWGMKALGILTVIMGVFSLTQTQSRGGLIGLVVMVFMLIILLVYWWGKRLPIWT
jgi:putative inorganic carbon (HCO3(-)) transporter